MRGAAFTLALAAIILAVISFAQAAGQSKNSVLLRNIKSLTLYKDRKTSHRRLSAIPQLQCVSGNGKGHYEIDVMRCTNSGSSYDEDNIDWTCKASLPPEFKLGSTDVLCEGYSSPDDPYVLKGSCGVEYRLILTELGEEKYGSKSWFSSKSAKAFSQNHVPDEESKSEIVLNFTFWCVFIGVSLYIGYVFISSLFCGQAGGGDGRGSRAGGGGGGDWDGDDGSDPPPPYDSRPFRQTYSKPRTSSRTTAAPSSSEGWRPGFWTGAATGAAASYAANQMSRIRREERARQQQQQGWFGRNTAAPGPSWFNAGEGPSQSTRSATYGQSSLDQPNSSRYESTGFGSTRRR